MPTPTKLLLIISPTTTLTHATPHVMATVGRNGSWCAAPVPVSPAAPLSPIVDRAIGDALVAYIEFQAPAGAHPVARMLITRDPSDTPLFTTTAAVSSRADGWAEARATIPIGDLQPGAYLARAELDVDGLPAGAISRPFSIVAR